MNGQLKAVLFGPVPSLIGTALSVLAAAAIVPGWLRRSRRPAAPPPAEPPQSDSSRLFRLLAAAAEPRAAANVLLDELAARFDLELANLAWIDDDARLAVLIAARDGGGDSPLLGQSVDLHRDPSGINAVLREGAPFSVYDAERSALVNPRLNAIAKAKSCVFLPVRAGDRVHAVVFGAVRRPRVFGDDELAQMQALVEEAAPALRRAGAAASLANELERERLIGRIGLEVRSRRDLDESLRIALEQTARATGSSRCLIRLGDDVEPAAVLAEWHDGIGSVGDADRLPAINIAAREQRTVAIEDVLDAPELEAEGPSAARELTERGVRGALATPLVAGDRPLGTLALHRRDPGPWSDADRALAEAVAAELAFALDTRALLRDRERRLAEQQALLKAGKALTSDLRFDTVIERLVEELLALVDADAADCWTLLPGGEELVCRAVLGLPESEIGRTIPVGGTIGEAIAGGKAVLRRDFARTEQPPPTPNYAQFAEVMDAPIVSLGEMRGVLGVCSREPGRFEESDLRLIEAFASLASIALRNAEAYEASARQAQVERGFYRIAAVLSEPLSEPETLDAVAQAAAEALGGQSAAVLRPTGAELELVGGFRLDPRLSAALVEHADSLAASARSGNVLAAPRLRDDGRFGEPLRRATEGVGHGSLLAVPLSGPGERDGASVVLVFFDGERSFEDEQLELAGQVAAAARGALERSDLYERERRSRSLAQRLARASRALAGELDPENVLEAAVNHAIELLGADGASARVLDGEEVVVRAASGAGDVQALETRTPSTGWLVGDMVQTRAMRAIDEIGDDTRVREADPMLGAGYEAYLGVPMIGPDDSVHGIIAVYAERPRRWREEEAGALQALAATAAAARSNAELYQGVSHEQQRSEAILANVADGIVAVDRDGKVVLWNPAAERVTGVPQSEALGRTPLEALGRPLDADGDTLGGSRLLPIRRGGAEVWLSLSEAVMTDPAGAVAGRIFAFRDISAERTVEQMKSEFVSTVSHELRTPLTSIFGFAETLLRQDVLFGEEERLTFLRYISSESERLTAIVDRLISVAQLETGDVSVQLAETDVGAVVNDAVRTVEEAAGRNGHRFVLDVDDGLAAEADREKLGQVLTHLLDNAIRYSPAGGTVTVAAHRRDDAVEVSVEDEGVGIAHGEQERIFRKFYRGDAAAAGAVGVGATGLGLYIAERLVKEMGGGIRVESGEGRGSTFVLELRAVASET